MLDNSKILELYNRDRKKPLILIPDTSFLLRLLFSLEKTKNKNDDIAFLKLLDSVNRNTPTITILSKSVIQEFLNLPVPCSLERIFKIEDGKITGINLDIEMFNTQYKFRDTSNSKDPQEIKIRFKKYTKRLEWLGKYLNNENVIVLDSQLDRLYNNEVKNTITTYNGINYTKFNDTELEELFYGNKTRDKSEYLTKILIKNKVRKDLGEISSAFSLLEFQKIIGFETPVRTIFTYNGNDDRGWFIETYQTFKDYYHKDSFEDILPLKRYKNGRSMPMDIYNPNSKSFDMENSAAGFGDVVDVGFMTTNGFKRILAEQFAKLSVKTGKQYYLYDPDESKDGELNIELFAQKIERSTEISESILGSTYKKLYKKYKDVRMKDIDPDRNNEISFRTGIKGPFETFCEKYPEELAKVAEEHVNNMREYHFTRGRILLLESREMISKASGKSRGQRAA